MGTKNIIGELTINGSQVLTAAAMKTIVLFSSEWTNNEQTVSVEGVTADNNILVSASGDPTAYAEAGIYCSAQADGSLTFKCTTIPTEDVLVSVYIGGSISGENEITVDEGMSDVSTNPVQNKVVKAYVDEKAGKVNYKLGIMTADGNMVRTYYDGSAEVNIDVVKAARCDANGNVISDTYAKTGSLAAVATSGLYNDLSGKPEIPTALPTPNGLIIFEHTDEVSPLITPWDGSSARTIPIVHSAHRDSANNVISETYVKLSQLGKATSNGVTGVATLGEDTKIPVAQLPLDTALSDTSTNPVQNKVIKAAIDAINTNIEGAGTGDMLKSVYDPDNTGIVVMAAQVQSPLIVDVWDKTSDEYSEISYDGSASKSIPGVRYARSADRDGDGNIIADTYAKTSSLATVATSGNYNDLINKPTSLPNLHALTINGVSYDGSEAKTITVDTAMSDESENLVQNKTIKKYIDDAIFAVLNTEV